MHKITFQQTFSLAHIPNQRTQNVQKRKKELNEIRSARIGTNKYFQN